MSYHHQIRRSRCCSATSREQRGGDIDVDAVVTGTTNNRSIENALIDVEGIVSSTRDDACSGETTAREVNGVRPEPPIKVEEEIPPEPLTSDAPVPLKVRVEPETRPVKVAVSAPAPPRRVDVAKAAAERLSLPAPPVMEESETPASAKVSLAVPPVMVLLTSAPAGVKVFSPLPPTIELEVTPPLKSKLSLPAPPMTVEAVTPAAFRSSHRYHHRGWKHSPSQKW